MNNIKNRIIVGNGMIAKALMNHPKDMDVVFFAAGVSDSKNSREMDFEREESLILKTINLYPNKLFIYFSTCGFYDPDISNSMYVLHKSKMESIIQSNSLNYIIFRVSNIIGISSNKKTIFNFLLKKLLNKERIPVWKNAYRNFIDIDQMTDFIFLFLDEFQEWKNRIINIAMEENTSVLDLIYTMMDVYQTTTEIELIDKGSNYFIPIDDLKLIISKKNIKMPDYNLKNFLLKYKGKL